MIRCGSLSLDGKESHAGPHLLSALGGCLQIKAPLSTYQPSLKGVLVNFRGPVSKNLINFVPSNQEWRK